MKSRRALAGRRRARRAAHACRLDAIARKQLGVRLLRAVFEHFCVPLATADTAGAFAFGLRLMAMDGTLEEVNDTAANAEYAWRARIGFGKTRSPSPQLRCLYLVEAGTHAEVSVIAAPCRASQQCLARCLLPALQPGMLVLVDRGFISGALVEAIRARGAHVLGRLPEARLSPQRAGAPRWQLVFPPWTRGTARACRLLCRCASWSTSLPHRQLEQLEQVTPSHMHSGSGTTNPQVRQVHRLLTTLLSPEQAPASALCLCYHERS